MRYQVVKEVWGQMIAPKWQRQTSKKCCKCKEVRSLNAFQWQCRNDFWYPSTRCYDCFIGSVKSLGGVK